MVYPDDQSMIVTEEDGATSSNDNEIEELIETSDEQIYDEQHDDNSEYDNSVNSEQENEGDTAKEDEASIVDDDLQGDRSKTENEEDVIEDAGKGGRLRRHGAGTGINRLEPILKGNSHTVKNSKVSFYQVMGINKRTVSKKA